ncbi:hypothetical protein [Enterovibrio norvegicus]|uniref:hypothetical protein n=1 Tax=Enterovibrio norvegicus TaxID=188144 RepID=UPI000C859B94|nr:hypothetical protein [Enterovibrio norvegicus]MCC4796980.1 hypothetical protein [Enterovibrio norvegicus]PMI40716.1 hypothetical protein BCU46_04765 [Enterovibrio norvegicus]
MQSDEMALDDTQTNDGGWPEFSAALEQVKKQEEEKQESSYTLPVNTENSNQGEVVGVMVSGALTLIEQLVSFKAGVDFEFNDKGKEEVISASSSVFSKYDLIGKDKAFAYGEEVALLFAVLGITLMSKRQIAVLKEEKAKHEPDEKSASIAA